jgi:hypothetical protein
MYRPEDSEDLSNPQEETDVELARCVVVVDFASLDVDVAAAQHAAMEAFSVDLEERSRFGDSSNRGGRRLHWGGRSCARRVSEPRGCEGGCPRCTFLDYLN